MKDESTKASIDKFNKSLEVCQLHQFLQTFIQTIKELEFTRATLQRDNVPYQTEKKQKKKEREMRNHASLILVLTPQKMENTWISNKE